jgi:hypothetical protein
MSNKNTALFGASLLAAIAAVAADHITSDAPKPVIAQQEDYNPCAAAVPAKPGQRSYDDLADDYSGDAAPMPPAKPAPGPADSNPCAAGAL